MTTENNEIVTDTDYDLMAKAVASGDTAELNRLMAVEVAPEPVTTPEKKEEETKPEDTTTTPADDQKPEDEGTTKPEDGETKPVTEPAKEPTVEELKQELHRLRSDAGRIPHVQSRNAQLERELAALKAAQAAAASTDGKPEEVALDAETQAVIDELKETDPVLAKAMERVAKMAVSTANNKVSTAFDTYSKTTQEAEEDRFIAEQYTVLTQAIPQAPQIFASQEWKQWKEGLSPGRRAMAESKYADEVATAINAFAADMQRLQGTTTVPAVTTPAAPVVNEAAEQALRERNRKVEQAAETKNPAAKTTTEFDGDKAFDELYRKLAKASHILP